MSGFRRVEDIDAWQKGIELCREVYAATKAHPFSQDYVLRDQIRRAAVSIPSNIAEGLGRRGSAEFLQFLSIAGGSVAELKTHLIIAQGEGYVSGDQYDALSALADDTGKLVSGLIRYIKRSSLKGVKYR